MLKYARVVDENTKLCEVGLGDNDEFYRSIGMAMQDVEEGYNGWYLAGYAPEKPFAVKAGEVRCLRDQYLAETDKYMLEDFPISAEERERYRLYRQYLRDVSRETEFPHIAVKTFGEWQADAAVA